MRAVSVIRPIQYLRGVAALMVVAHHAANQIAGASSHYGFHFGTSGVDLFFVISGFIMVVSLKDMSPQEFMKRRIVRVVPLYWLLTLCMIGCALLAPSLFKTLRFSAETVLYSLLFIPHSSLSFPGLVWPVLVPGWTLNFEMFFYSAFALSVFLPPAYRLAALASTFGGLVASGYAFGPFESAVLQTYTSPLLIEFVCGVSIGRLWTSGRLTVPLWMSVCAMVGGAALLVLRDQPPLLYFNQIVGAALLVTGALNQRFGLWHNRILQAMGDASYSTYLTHIFTLGVLRVAWVKLVPDAVSAVSAWAFMLLGWVTCLAVGWLAYRVLEQPLLHRFSPRHVAAR